MDTKEQVIAKLKRLCAERFGDDAKRMFDNYAVNENIDRNGLLKVLEEADIGGRFTRGIYATKVMEEIDKNNDGLISFVELSIVSRQGDLITKILKDVGE